MTFGIYTQPLSCATVSKQIGLFVEFPVVIEWEIISLMFTEVSIMLTLAEMASFLSSPSDGKV